MTRVLVIHDDIDMTDMLTLSLEPQAFEVKIALSAKEGIKLIRQWNPDLVILDYMTPTKQLLRLCQAINRLSQVPILALSVINQPNVIAEVLDAGADDYLTKPVASGVLAAYINKMTRRNTDRLKLPASPSI